MEKFAIGLLIGGVGGALLVANNYKMRALVKKGQEEVQNKLDEFMDDKIQKLEKKADDVVDTVKEKTQKTVKKIKKATTDK